MTVHNHLRERQEGSGLGKWLIVWTGFIDVLLCCMLIPLARTLCILFECVQFSIVEHKYCTHNDGLSGLQDGLLVLTLFSDLSTRPQLFLVFRGNYCSLDRCHCGSNYWCLSISIIVVANNSYILSPPPQLVIRSFFLFFIHRACVLHVHVHVGAAIYIIIK